MIIFILQIQQQKYIIYNLNIEYILPLQIPINTKFRELQIKQELNLIDLFKSYIDIENLTYKYEQFNQTVNIPIVKQLTFMYLPNILCIQLKRFIYDKKLGKSFKLKNNIKIPEEIDLKDYVNYNFRNLNTKTKYILCSAILHIGKTVNSGHYITINKDFKENKYYVYDDLNVYKLTSYNSNIPRTDDININNSAYILFYIKI